MQCSDQSVSDSTDTLVSSVDVPVLLGVEYSLLSWLKVRMAMQRNLVGGTLVKTTASHDTNADGTVDTTSTSTTETNNIHDWLFRLGFGISTERIGWDVLFNLQPNDADYVSPFFTSPAKISIARPSITTAVAYKW